MKIRSSAFVCADTANISPGSMSVLPPYPCCSALSKNNFSDPSQHNILPIAAKELFISLLSYNILPLPFPEARLQKKAARNKSRCFSDLLHKLFFGYPIRHRPLDFPIYFMIGEYVSGRRSRNRPHSHRIRRICAKSYSAYRISSFSLEATAMRSPVASVKNEDP